MADRFDSVLSSTTTVYQVPCFENEIVPQGDFEDHKLGDSSQFTESFAGVWHLFQHINHESEIALFLSQRGFPDVLIKGPH